MTRKKLLVTGASGFLGGHASRFFSRADFDVFGIGHGQPSRDVGLSLQDYIDGSVAFESLKVFGLEFDYIIHCAGGGKVHSSIEEPYSDFRKTVGGTAALLEYLRLENQNAYLIYPSSASVVGEIEEMPISENSDGFPASPYSMHKKICEQMCNLYVRQYGLKIGILRLFSIFGEGLKKQIMWDSVRKFGSDESPVIFKGSGEETRDFIHIEEVLNIFNVMLDNEIIETINGGTGEARTVREVVGLIKKSMQIEKEFIFEHQTNKGNPTNMQASTEKLEEFYQLSNRNFNSDVAAYVYWARKV